MEKKTTRFEVNLRVDLQNFPMLHDISSWSLMMLELILTNGYSMSGHMTFTKVAPQIFDLISIIMTNRYLHKPNAWLPFRYGVRYMWFYDVETTSDNIGELGEKLLIEVLYR